MVVLGYQEQWCIHYDLSLLANDICRPKMVVFGSREQLCIHDEVSLLRGKAQTNACHLLCRKRGKRNCVHHSRVAGNSV